MQAKDIMTRNVVTASTDTTVGEIAKLLVGRGISGVPIVDADDHVLGIVSEGDLMRRAEIETERKPSWWLRMFADGQVSADAFVKSHGTRAEDIMTRNVAIVGEDASLGEIAELLEEKHVKRVPVVHDGKLVGIISRANLLQALIARQEEMATPPTADDRSIRAQVLQVANENGWVTHGSLNPLVKDGNVELWGWVESQAERKALLMAVQEIAGVQGVKDRLGSVPPWVYGA